jgi:hypothetical protein
VPVVPGSGATALACWVARDTTVMSYSQDATLSLNCLVAYSLLFP